MIEKSPLKLSNPRDMSTTNVVSLDAFRGHREARLRLTLALNQADEDRRLLSLRLWEAVELADGDRAALVWIDEYGPGLVHTHCIVDLLSDRPRRAFAMEPLRRAWDRGIPGLLDEPDLGRSEDRIFLERPRSLCAVALGSDGIRAWFLVIDSRTSRAPFRRPTADSLMFLAGECAAIVIHDDLDEAGAGSKVRKQEGEDEDHERTRMTRFPGWPVLQDVKDAEQDASRSRTVTLRFLVARLLRSLVDDDFSVDPDEFGRQVAAVRSELHIEAGADREIWERVLDALEGDDFGELSRSVIERAAHAENQGHFHGARELYRLAYDVAAAGCHAEASVDAARLLGRVSRGMGAWSESKRWYEQAGSVARAAGLRRGEALALDGLGNTHRAKGNLPHARTVCLRVLEIGDELEDRDIQARAHQNLALVEKHAGHTDDALRHGWAAVQSFTNAYRHFVALADLADIFMRCGELESARHAYELVAAGVDNLDVRVVALDALGHIAALQGDRKEFERRLHRLDREPLDDVRVEVRAEILLHRGKSYLAVGDSAEAENWLRRSVAFSEKHGVSRTLFEAERVLEDLVEARNELLVREMPTPAPETMNELHEPLHALTAPASASP